MRQMLADSHKTVHSGHVSTLALEPRVWNAWLTCEAPSVPRTHTVLLRDGFWFRLCRVRKEAPGA
jgi:hypothetical protein